MCQVDPAWPTGSVHVHRVFCSICSWWRMLRLGWRDVCRPASSMKHGDCWINTLSSFITQLLAIGFFHSRSNSLPNNDKCLHPCDCCPEEPTSAKEQLHSQRTISKVDFYTYLDAAIILQQAPLPWCKCYILISFYGCIHPISSVSTELDEASPAKEEAHVRAQAEGERWWMVAHMWQIKHLTSNLLFLITWNIVREEGQGKE